MPARKSAPSAASPEDNSRSTSKDEGLSVEDLSLPKSMVQRLSKGVLPPNTQIQKDALLSMSKSATVFVNYLTTYAAEMVARSGKKTIMPQDVFDSLQELEFDAFLPRLEAEVDKFQSIRANKRNSYRKKVRDGKKGIKDGDETETRGANGHNVDDESPPAKRARRSSADNGEQHSASEDDVDADEAADDVEPEDDDVEDDEVEEEVIEEGLTEDPIEERENDPSEDEMADGDESD